MPYYTDNKHITLNSAYATKLNGSYLSNCIFPFQGILSDDSNIIKVYVSLVNAQIPCSFYTIDQTNNTLLLSTGSVIVPSGNYNANSFISALTSNGLIVSVTFNKINGKLTFNFPTATDMLMSNISGVIGLTEPILNASGIELQQPLNLLGIKRILIKSDALQVESFTSVNFSSGGVLATLTVNQPAFNLISYENTTDLSRLVCNAKILNSIDIEMFDENGDFINFNGIDWTITIVLSVERKYDEVERKKLFDVVGVLPPSKKLPEQISELSQNEKDLELLQNP